nr:hypothetical protein [bacterium]
SSVVVRDVFKGALNPANVAMMVGGFALARITTAAVMSKLSSAGLGGLTFSGKAVSLAAEIGIEAAAFTFYQRALATAFTSQRIDWSPKAFAGDWATLALSFGFLRASGFPLAVLRRGMEKSTIFKAGGAAGNLQFVKAAGRSSMNAAGRGLFAATENMTHAGMFYAASRAAHAAKWTDSHGSFLEQFLMLAEFKLGLRFAGRFTGGWTDRKFVEIKKRPAERAAKAIAERIAPDEPRTSGPLARRIIDILGKGKISEKELAAMKRLLRKGDLASADAKAAVNDFLKKIDVQFTFDGKGLVLKVQRRPRPVRMAGPSQPGIVSVLSMGLLDLGEITKKTAFGTVHDNLTDCLLAKEARGDLNRVNLLLAGPGGANLAEQIYRWFGSTVVIHRWDGVHLKSKKFVQPKLFDRAIALDSLRGIEPKGRLTVIGKLVDSLCNGGEVIITLPQKCSDPFTEALRKPQRSLLGLLEKAGYSVFTTSRMKDGGAVEDLVIRKHIESNEPFSMVLAGAVREWIASGRPSD